METSSSRLFCHRWREPHAALLLGAFGQDGPYVDQGYVSSDLVTMAMGGVLQSCGYDLDDGLPPMRPGPYHSFYTAGHYGCFVAMAALWESELSGRGQYIDVAAEAFS